MKNLKISSSSGWLIKKLSTGEISPTKLSAHQRRIVIKYYMEEMSHVSNTFISQLIGITDVHVSRIKRELLRKGSWEIDSIDVKMLAVSLKKKKDELQRKAMSDRHWGLAWRIECEYIEQMQNLGFIYKAPEKHLIGSYEEGVVERLKDMFKEVGVPSVDEFITQFKKLPGGNGRGETKLLVKARK